jgi:hypothetical protein
MTGKCARVSSSDSTACKHAVTAAKSRSSSIGGTAGGM